MTPQITDISVTVADSPVAITPPFDAEETEYTVVVPSENDILLTAEADSGTTVTAKVKAYQSEEWQTFPLGTPLSADVTAFPMEFVITASNETGSTDYTLTMALYGGQEPDDPDDPDEPTEPDEPVEP